MRLAAFLLVLTITSSAAAQATDRERAEAHFNAGRKLRANKRCDLAIDELQQSIELEPGIGAHLNLGDCLEMTGKLVEAFGAFKAAETLARREDDPRLEEARKSGARVEAKLVRVLIKEDEPDLRLSVDGKPVGAKPWNIVLTPDADHVIAGTTSDHRQWEERVHGKAGEILRLTPVLTVPAPPPPAAPTRAPERERPFPTVAVLTGGVGAAALVAGSTFGVMAMSARSDLAEKVASDSRCTGGYPNGSCDPSSRAALDPIESRAAFTSSASTICFIAGAGLLVAGAVLYFVSPAAKKTAQLNW
jgi:hypothetical protein